MYAIIRISILALAISLALAGIVQSQTISQEEQQSQSIAYPAAQYYEDQQRQTIGTPGAGVYEDQQLQSIAYNATYNQTANETATVAAPSQYTVSLADSPAIGQYLVDQKGLTLYYFKNDTQGSSSCSGQCAVLWPPFYAQSVALGPGLNQSDFAMINRTDGTEQLTFRGWPLYYYYMDTSPGDVKGQGIGGVWFVVNPNSFNPK